MTHRERDRAVAKRAVGHAILDLGSSITYPDETKFIDRDNTLFCVFRWRIEDDFFAGEAIIPWTLFERPIEEAVAYIRTQVLGAVQDALRKMGERENGRYTETDKDDRAP